MEQHDDSKSDSWGKLMDEFYDLLNRLDDHQKDQLFEVIADPDKLGNLVNDNYLGKDRPNFIDKVEPIADWLLPLWRLETDSSAGLRTYLEDIAHKAEDKRKGLLEADLHNYILNIIALFDHHQQQYVWRLWGALWLMERLDLKGCADLVFLLLRQDYFFLDFYFGNDKMEVAQASLYHFFSDTPDALYDFLRERRIIPESRIPVFGALALMASQSEKNRLQAVSLIIKYLNVVYDVGKQNGNMQNVESYIYLLAHNKVKEALPMLQKIYDDTVFLRVSIADSNDVAYIMNHPDSDGIPNHTHNFALNLDNVLEDAALWEKLLMNDEQEEWEEVF